MDDKISHYVVTVIMPWTSTNLTEVENHGNFRALLDFRVDAGDTLLDQHLTTAARNATYTSSVIQNQVIDVLSDQVR